MKPLYTEEEFNSAKSTDLLKFECEYCGKEFTREKKYIKYSLKKGNNIKYCCKECADKGSITRVKVNCTLCNKEFDVQLHEFKRSITKRFFCGRSHRVSYFNTLRKGTPLMSEIGKKISESLKKKPKSDYTKFFKTYHCKECGKPFTMQDNRNTTGRQYCSSECRNKWVKENCKTGGYRKGSGRGKSGWYKGIYCDSSWELAFVVYHLDNDIPIKRCKEIRKYIFENKEHEYHPDFVVNGKLYEIKGYNTKQWEAKQEQNKDIIVLRREEIKPYIEYCHNKYGNNFISLYDNSKPQKNLLDYSFVWIHKGDKNMTIKPYDLETYLNDGWVRGRFIKKL